MENFPEASIVEIGSVGLYGGKHYSIHDLLGYSVQGMVYVVANIPLFRAFMSAKLESDFLRRNPSPSQGVRAAFTAFMHQNKLHWSRCCRGSAGHQETSLKIILNAC
jgi:hypothetical protein